MLIISFFSIMTADAQQNSPAADTIQQDNVPWWKKAVFYQIYLRSFKDSNADGVGDINGVIEKLDYLKNLGVDVIWISPHYDSPLHDGGYDVADYRKILKAFGNLSDFDRLIAELKKRDMHLMIDMVINHTSDQNAWFVASRSSKNNPYRDYYIWREGKGDQPPNNYPSFMGGSAWQKSAETDQYYLHYYGKQMPDLNWDNEKVRNEMAEIINFWLDKGVSGLRFDSLVTISKTQGLPDLNPQELKNFPMVYASGPNVHRYFSELKSKLKLPAQNVIAGEMFAVPLDQNPMYTDPARNEANLAIIYDVIRFDRDAADRWFSRPWTLSQLRKTITRVDQSTGEHGWNAFFLTNHDNQREVSHYGSDKPQYRENSAKALATLQLTQRASPFIYQGAELGMTNYPFKSLADFHDIEDTGFIRDYVDSGKVDPALFFKHLSFSSRDNSRTPMQWDDTPQAGFTTATPWLAVNPNYPSINAKNQVNDDNSVYNYFRKLITIRRDTPALVTGTQQDLDPDNNEVLAYTRTLGSDKYLIIINFTEAAQQYALPQDLSIEKTVVENNGKAGADESRELTLNPWQSGVYKVKSR
ncbi:alpha-glucosidase [Affinibrenneria salicis]|uniref:Alpha-glucosidase n=2 Tax=Affinibrenneria salicis TaxID=2590031 RepID=A0A5J5FSK8_9GAMM|nr:alpha-glucosidase [Affinibrenneria salicis]